jgi:molybdate/tungstate transport system substrate-binding protein
MWIQVLMVCQLAELYYKNPTIFKNLITQNFYPKISVTKTDESYIILVPEVLEPKSEKIILRGGSVQLLALIKSGGLDYALQYRSVVSQYGLKFLELPPEINLGSAKYESFYKKSQSAFLCSKGSHPWELNALVSQSPTE